MNIWRRSAYHRHPAYNNRPMLRTTVLVIVALAIIVAALWTEVLLNEFFGL